MKEGTPHLSTPAKYNTYPPSSLCKKCKGKCCIRAPGPYHPSDFPHTMTTSYLLELLESSKVVINWKDGNGRNTYFLRPPNELDNSHLINNRSGGACTFLESTGCSLPPKERPLGCRSLRPDKSLICSHADYDQYKAFRAWSRYRKVIEEVMEIIDKRKKGNFGNGPV